MQIYSAYYHSPVGVLRISGTESYISEVHFMKEDEEMTASDYLPATLINCTEQLIQYFNGERRNFDLPINQLGTAFQQEVWIELRTIPYAKTISYLDLARKIGDSKATRAVANANGRNNIAIIVPCHRVIGSNKELIGYGGGLWRKKWLLEHETKVAYGVQTLF
jgi:methylated-DNA-[protein]-cysteine S-methyltransferase